MTLVGSSLSSVEDVFDFLIACSIWWRALSTPFRLLWTHQPPLLALTVAIKVDKLLNPFLSPEGMVGNDALSSESQTSLAANLARRAVALQLFTVA